MKIALIGYGKMGKAIETIAQDRGHEIVARFNSSNPPTSVALKAAEMAIEISRPESAIEHMLLCFKASVPVVTGTTGWYDDFAKVEQALREHEGALLHATNFSLGVNIFFEINRKLAALLHNHPEYRVSLEEIHHLQKLDAPSGTAITLAKQILEEQSQLSAWQLIENGEAEDADKLPIHAKRLPDVPGTHSVTYTSEIDSISITHEAHSRKGFALGAVLAMEFLHKKSGIYTMKDVLNV